MALNMKRDNGGAAIQAFCPDPALCLAPQIIISGATYTLERSAYPAAFIRFFSTGDVQVYLNGMTTAFMTYPGGGLWDLILDDDVYSVSFVNNTGGSVTLQMWGR